MDMNIMCRRYGDDYPSGLMALRLRFRRMICFLKRHGLFAVAHELEKEAGVFFDAHYMKKLMRIGRWEDAKEYMMGFTPTTDVQWSDQCLDLIHHLQTTLILAAVAAGGPKAAGYLTYFDHESILRNPYYAIFQKLVYKMHADQPSASILWKKAAPDAVNKAMHLVANCPELKSKMQKLPSNKPWEVTPLIGAQRRRRSIARTSAHALSRAFLLHRKRIHSNREKNANSEQQALVNVEAQV